MTYNKKLSVIVPVYKGEKFIVDNLRVMQESFSRYFRKLEIIVVIDGNLDKSYEEAKKVKGIKVVGYTQNRGKGFALKYGFNFCTGDFITFIDADMDIHPDVFWNFIPYLTTADMVIGSKRHPFSKLSYPLTRQILSTCYMIFTWVVLGLRLRDTQSGLKIMKKELLDVIMPLILVKRYAFDVELCFLAYKHGFRIVEAPVEIKYRFNGSGISGGTILGMLMDTLAIRYRYSILHYYQKKYHQVRFSRE